MISSMTRLCLGKALAELYFGGDIRTNCPRVIEDNFFCFMIKRSSHVTTALDHLLAIYLRASRYYFSLANELTGTHSIGKLTTRLRVLCSSRGIYAPGDDPNDQYRMETAVPSSPFNPLMFDPFMCPFYTTSIPTPEMQGTRQKNPSSRPEEGFFHHDVFYANSVFTHCFRPWSKWCLSH